MGDIDPPPYQTPKESSSSNSPGRAGGWFILIAGVVVLGWFIYHFYPELFQ